MKEIFLGVIAAGVLMASFVLPAHALTISPAKLDITGDPGRTISSELELVNEQKETKTFYASFENFEASGESGAPHFIGGNAGLATWIQIQPQVTLQPGEKAIVPFHITIPKNTEPGGYFAAIFWGTQPVLGDGGGQVSIGGKLGLLILLRVSGEVKEGGGLLDFSLKNGKLSSSLPVGFAYRINNTGGDRIVPIGEIRIKNMLRMTSATLPANASDGSVLPGSARKFETVWGAKLNGGEQDEQIGFFGMARRQLTDFHFGPYTAALHLTWGSGNQVATASAYFFIIPWQLLIIVMCFILFLLVFIKAYNRWLIAKITNK